jgi:hypothetical protein
MEGVYTEEICSPKILTEERKKKKILPLIPGDDILFIV